MGCHPPASVLWHEVVVLSRYIVYRRYVLAGDSIAAGGMIFVVGFSRCGMLLPRRGIIWGPQLSLPSRQKNALRWRLSSGHVSSNATSRVMSRVLRPSPPLQSPAMDMADLAQTSIQERIIH
jgi:hypothetical protein